MKSDRKYVMKICASYKVCDQTTCENGKPHEENEACVFTCGSNMLRLRFRRVTKKEEVLFRMTGKI